MQFEERVIRCCAGTAHLYCFTNTRSETIKTAIQVLLLRFFIYLPLLG